MRILLDVDGVVADWSGGLLRAAGSSLTAADVTQWDIFGLMKPVEAARAKEVCGTADFWRDLEVIDGALDGVARLRSAGHKILWVTAPWWSCDGWVQARTGWLRRHFDVPYADVICCSCKWAVSGDALIDDKADNVTAWAEHNPAGQALLFSAPYNGDASLRRVDWPSLPGALLSTDDTDDRVLTTHAAAKLVHVNPSSIAKWVEDGRIGAYRTPGGHRRIRAAELRRFLEAHGMPVPRTLDTSPSPR